MFDYEPASIVPARIMEAVVSVVLPVFGIVLCGFLAGRTKVLGAASSDALNGFVYWVALPALFLRSLSRAPLDRILDWPLIGAYLGATACMFLIALPVAHICFGARLGAASLHALTTAFPNSGYIGVPLFLLAFGEAGSLPVIVATVSQSVTILLVSIVLIEAEQGSGRRLRRARRIILNLLGNPLLLSSAAGLGLNAAGLPLEGPFDIFVQTLAAAASPCALFALGLFMVGKSMTEGWAEISWMAFAKLAIHPALMWLTVTQLFQFPPDIVRGLVLTAAMPTGALVFVVAQKYGVFVQRGSATVLVTTVLSLLTLSALFVVYGV